MMALFPSLAAFVSLYGLFFDPSSAKAHLAILTGLLPADALTLVGEEMVRIASRTEGSLSVTFAASLILALWSVNTGMKVLIRGLNIAYVEREKRGFVQLNITSLALTASALLFLLMIAGLLLVLPGILAILRAPPETLSLAALRWPMLFGMALVAVAVLYRFGPSRTPARWRWLTWGAVLAAGLWLGGSLLFSWYVSAFSSFSATYGSLGAVFGFMIWSWLSSLFILFGAKLNAEIEHQTAVDTTIRGDKPLGQRGAVVADTLGQRAPPNGLATMAQKGGRALKSLLR